MIDISKIMSFSSLETVMINNSEQLVLLLSRSKFCPRVRRQNISAYLEVNREGYFFHNLLTPSSRTIVNHPLEMEDKYRRQILQAHGSRRFCHFPGFRTNVSVYFLRCEIETECVLNTVYTRVLNIKLEGEERLEIEGWVSALYSNNASDQTWQNTLPS